MNKVVVIGSLNLDIIQNIKRLPLQGETLRIDERSMNLGGKGANQAVAAARQGAEVSFIGAIGKDEAGQQFKTLLEDEVSTFLVCVKRIQQLAQLQFCLKKMGTTQFLCMVEPMLSCQLMTLSCLKH